MSYMFYGCISLTNINLTNFNIQNVTNMTYMFNGCASLKMCEIITNNNKILREFKNYYKNKYY